MASRVPAALLLVMSCSPSLVQGEIFRLKEDKVPGNWTLSMLYFFYIYNHGDAPDATGEAFVKFANLGFTSVKRTDDQIQDYNSLQISIIKYEHFWDVINPRDFCCTSSDVTSMRCEKENQIRFRRQAKKGP